ncbi:MAG: hypothetical protein WCO35_03025 [Candidatus Nomurabacteria bacterium]
MNKFTKLKKIATGAILIGALSVTLAGAQTATSSTSTFPHRNLHKKVTIVKKTKSTQQIIKHSISGTITAIDGNTIAISVGEASSTTTYTIDASSSIIIKPGATSTGISILSINDKILVNGTIVGTNVSAKSIHVENKQQINKTIKKTIKKTTKTKKK